MSNLAKHLKVKNTPVTQKIPGREAEMVANNTGGFVFGVDKWSQFQRFVTIGAEKNFYSSEAKLTVDNAKNVLECIKENGPEVVRRLTEISVAGRAPKNDAAIFVLALCASFGDAATKSSAGEALPKVCRIGTHLFQFVAAVNELRGWGRSLRNAIGAWYTNMDASKLAIQVSKYQQRDGWSHRDVLRLSHPKFADATHNAIAHWAVKGWEAVGDSPHDNPALVPIWAFEKAKRAKSASEIINLITDYGLVREHIPTNFLNDVGVWEALLVDMPITALIRNLGKMTSIGVLKALGGKTKLALDALGDSDKVRKSRVHPITILNAMKIYGQGHGDKGSLSWTPVQSILNSLDAAFYTAFGNVESTGKSHLLALDVSGSMAGATIAGSSLTAREASAAMALVTANVEPQHLFIGFTASGDRCGSIYNSGVSVLNISPRQRLDDVIKYIDRLGFSATDCSLPFKYAEQNKLEVDAFIVLTDNEINSSSHPSQALAQYRKAMKRPDAKSVVVATSVTNFSIADPKDPRMLDVAGFDTAAPQVISEFIRG